MKEVKYKCDICGKKETARCYDGEEMLPYLWSKTHEIVSGEHDSACMNFETTIIRCKDCRTNEHEKEEVDSPTMPPKSSKMVVCIPTKEYFEQKKLIEQLVEALEKISNWKGLSWQYITSIADKALEAAKKAGY